MSQTYRFHTLDVFTDTLFGGNPLAVLPDATGLSTKQMEHITREFNLSETVFVFPPEDPRNTRRVRIFTPGRELPFAGHPTVGTAFLLAATGMIPVTEPVTRIVLEEGVGPVPITIDIRNGTPVSAEFTTAQAPEFRSDVPSASDVAEILSLHVSDVARGSLPIEAASCGVAFLLAPLASREAVSRSRLDRAVWERILARHWAPEVFLFDASAAAGGGAIRARMFAPALGVGEDPATGSAGAAFAAYLAKYASDGAPLKWTVEQGFEMGRPSTLSLSVDKRDGQIDAVRVAGCAVLVGEGTLRVS